MEDTNGIFVGVKSDLSPNTTNWYRIHSLTRNPTKSIIHLNALDDKRTGYNIPIKKFMGVLPIQCGHLQHENILDSEEMQQYRCIAVGDTVHIDSDNEEWGERICADGEVLEVFDKKILVYLPDFEGGCNVMVLRTECCIK